MPAGRRSARAHRDPRRDLVRLVDRLIRRSPYVTDADLEAAAGRPSSRLASDQLPDLIAAAVDESLLLKDLRTFFDRDTGTFTQAWVYRVNARHPFAAHVLALQDS